MKQFNLFCCLALLFLLTACGGKEKNEQAGDNSTETTTETATSAESQEEAMAKDLCNCMQPITDLYKKIKGLTADGNVDALSDMMDDLEDASEEADECVDALYEKYGEMADESKEETILRKVCPEVADLLVEMEE